MTVWLFGDSIFRGAALGRFAEDFAPQEAAAEPLWPMRSPATVMNLMLGEDAVRYGGVTGLPDGVDKAARQLSRMLRAGTIGDSDTLVFLDVGEHAGDPDRQEAQWRILRDAAVAAHPLRLIMCSGFDNGARGRPAFMHDRPIGGRSINDAVRAAACAPADHQGRTSFLDLSAPLAAYHQQLQAGFGGGAYHRDGVHLNVWGQLRLCVLILAKALPGRSLDTGPVSAFAAERWKAMGARSPDAAAAMAALAWAQTGAPEASPDPLVAASDR